MLRTPFVFVVLSASGCELVANIQDLHLTTDASIGDGGAPVDAPDEDDATQVADASDGATNDVEDAGIVTELIDDMEANNGLILATKGRSGAWFTYNDGTATGTQTPTAGGPFLPSMIQPPRGSSNYAARTWGSGFTTWGAGMGFNVNDPPSGPNKDQRSTYDASGYAGFVFWARIGSADAGAATSVRFNVPSKDTDPAGGVCSPVSACSDYFGVTLSLSDTWTMYVIEFTDMHQEGWGQPVASFDASTMYGCEFKVDQNKTFDVWIDDIAFLLP